MSKNVITNLALITNGDMSLASLTSPTINELYLDNLGIQCVWTGAPVGVLAVNGSVDGVTFIALTFNPVLGQPAGSPDKILINVNQFPFRFLQVTYTKTSGTGTLNVIMTCKEL